MLLRGARRWHTFKYYLLAALGAGFALSGVTELVVSGAEALGALSGVPSPGQFRDIRQFADDALAVGLALAGAALLLFPVLKHVFPPRHHAAGPQEEPW
jgi:hypothetical protein